MNNQQLFRFLLLPRVGGRLVGTAHTVAVAEAFRGALLRSLPPSRVASVIAGHGPLAKNHVHAHFLPIDCDGDGLIDALDIWLPLGIDAETEGLLRKNYVVYDRNVIRGGLIAEPLGAIESQRAATWKTSTPVVLDRFPKLRGSGTKHVVDSPEEQVSKALEWRGLQSATIQVRPLARADRQYVVVRKGGRPLPAYLASLTFEEPVEGPIILGSLAHFGLGRFEPCN